MCQCLIFLDDPEAVADILEKLIKGNEDQVLMAYQIGFDLYESATQQFLQRIQSALRATAPVVMVEGKDAEVKKEPAKEKESSMETEESETGEKEKEEKKEETPAPPAPKVEELSESDKEIQASITKLTGILGGNTTIALNLQFLIRNNKSDLQILKNTKVR